MSQDELTSLGLRSLKLVRKGAEAHIYEAEWLGKPVVVKHRVPKAYRHPELDRALRARRTVREAQAIHRAKEAGVPTPAIYLVDRKTATIIMEHVEGERLKELLAQEGRRALGLMEELGRLVGCLHRAGLIHGDITTSNVIRTPDGRLVLVDFGLSEFSADLERRGVDLHLLKRVLESTHHEVAREAWEAFLRGYRSVLGDEADDVVNKVREIELRGRYVTERARHK
ncbi:Kae1-associated kinase Bud32 [Candidatus Bathyarchaeota archaeon ex4484_135]|nr:MAG: Kae1-associated kinase Bud32 [Candidatus Bathyarchaeota archaeon ex4484_135]